MTCTVALAMCPFHGCTNDDCLVLDQEHHLPTPYLTRIKGKALCILGERRSMSRVHNQTVHTGAVDSTRSNLQYEKKVFANKMSGFSVPGI